jgi:hypothetical protein
MALELHLMQPRLLMIMVLGLQVVVLTAPGLAEINFIIGILE